MLIGSVVLGGSCWCFWFVLGSLFDVVWVMMSIVVF